MEDRQNPPHTAPADRQRDGGAVSLTLEDFEPSDVDEVRRLHEACFPLKYDDHFYLSLQNGEYGGRSLFSVVVPASCTSDLTHATGDSNLTFSTSHDTHIQLESTSHENDFGIETDAVTKTDTAITCSDTDAREYLSTQRGNPDHGPPAADAILDSHAASDAAFASINVMSDDGRNNDNAREQIELEGNTDTPNSLARSLDQVTISDSFDAAIEVNHQINSVDTNADDNSQGPSADIRHSHPRSVCAGAIAQICDGMQGEDAAGLLSPECIREGITQCCYILTVAVHETHRRQGLATRLLHACIDYAKRDKQCGVVYLHVITNNAPALAFYQRNGFAHVKTCYNFYRIDGCNYNAFLYALYLPPAQPTATVAKRLRLIHEKANGSSSQSSWQMPQWRGRANRIDVAAVEGKQNNRNRARGGGGVSGGGGWWSRVVESVGLWIRSLGVVVGLEQHASSSSNNSNSHESESCSNALDSMETDSVAGLV